MSGVSIPAYVDVRKAFAQETELCGEMPVKRLPRFREYLASESATIRVSLRFNRNRIGQRQIEGHISARVEMTCQRCLRSVALDLTDEIRLVLLASESQSDSLETPWEPWVCAEQKLELADLVEEQLILALPIVNLHEDAGCIAELEYRQKADTAGEKAAVPQKENPFSVLKNLKDTEESGQGA